MLGGALDANVIIVLVLSLVFLALLMTFFVDLFRTVRKSKVELKRVK